MMRFLLVNPYYPISEGPSPPLGLAFLGAALEQAGIEVRVLDLVVFPYSKQMLESVLKSFQPHFIGSTAVTMSFQDAIGVIQDAKQIDPDIYTVMGGPHVTFCAPETMEAYPQLDFIVMGEGEEVIVQLVREAENGKKWDTIRGIAYREGGSVQRTAENKPSLDVNTLPLPARHLLPLGRYRALNMPISMTTSRGCPHKCIFCVGRKMVGSRVRYRNPESVVDEMEALSRLGFFQINVADDLFTANKKHCIRICDEIMRRGLSVKWSSFARVDTVSLEVLKKMKAAGCDSVSFGIETGSPEILKIIRKGITLDQVTDAVRMCNDAGILACGSFILGLPGETPETLEETLAFSRTLEEMDVSFGFHLLAPFPGTRVREEAEQYGIRILTHDWPEYHANRAIVETETVKKERLDAIADEWERNIETWLGHIREKMEKGEATEEEAFPLVNLERTLIVYEMMMQDTLRANGSWPQEGTTDISEEQSLQRLVENIPESVSPSREKIHAALTYQIEKKNLRIQNGDGRVQWGWVDYL